MANTNQNAAQNQNPGSGNGGAGGAENGGNSGSQRKGGGNQEKFRSDCVIEIDERLNRSVSISTLREKLRSRFSLTKLATRKEGPVTTIGDKVAGMPDIPGLRIALDSRNMRYRIYDPLERDPDLVKQINEVRKRSSIDQTEITFVPQREATLDEDRWKTLAMELRRKVDSEMCRVIDGKLPSMEDLEELPGKRLADPMNSGRKPRYHDQIPEWESKIDSLT